MYYKIQDFISDWTYESEATLKILDCLNDRALSQRVTPDGRNLGFIAWHIAETIGEMITRTGLKVFRPDEKHYDVTRSSVIRECYKSSSESLVEKIKANWTDDSLMEEDEMYGEKWKRGYTLDALVKHQAHHRGQMTVLMRQAGLKVPGVYGPAYEEWAQWGMEAPK